jgi:hypothetical protein
VLLSPGPPEAFDSVAVKDPSIVRYQGAWHLFYTARNRAGYSLGYVRAPKLEQLEGAPRFALTQLHPAKSSYAAAPQVFYFRPQRKWYLVFQTDEANYLPVYSTTASPAVPGSWSAPQPLVEKRESAKWIDFWIVCDDRSAYLFYTRDHREAMVMSTRLEDFPRGFSNPRAVFSPVHEAVHVYSVAGSRPAFAMLFERQSGDLRRFGLARSTSLAGPWTPAEEDFAGGEQLDYLPGRPRWTEEVSHGELLRQGYDERMEVSADLWEFLIQGLPAGEHRGEYPLLPWRLGLIRTPAVEPAEKRAPQR